MTTPTPLTPPSDAPLKLEAPAPVEVVPAEQSSSFLPVIAPAREKELESQAKEYVLVLSKQNPNSPDFQKTIDEVSSLAKAEVAKSAVGSSVILQRRSTSLASAKSSGQDPQIAVASTLADLRSTVDDLTPTDELTVKQRFLSFLPGGKRIQRYFQRYETAQTQLNKIEKSLIAGQSALQKDNASLEVEKRNLWEVMNQLNEYIAFAHALDTEVANRVETMKASGDIEGANKVETDLLFVIRQRRQDLLTQLAVSVQSYLAMDLIRKNNVELIKGVDRARSTTMFALRTAVITAQALANQTLVLDQIDALNAATDRTIARTGEMLRQNAGRVHEQAVNSGVSIETLKKAFDDIYATIDEIDAFKTAANQSMATTITSLEDQLVRAQPALERAKNGEELENGSSSSLPRLGR